MSSTVSDLGKHVIAREPGMARSGIATDLRDLCLIAALGLIITALVFAFGFGPDVTQALGMSG
jgi:hypothetical protein